MDNDWPDFATAEAMAKQASANGFLLEMEQSSDGACWRWTWIHAPTGMDFDGECDNTHKAIALICALLAVPMIAGFSVDLSTDS
jgi:hypothetical protein